MNDMPGAVLFACTENALRSPMAESMLKYFQGHRIYVDSVGVRAGKLDDFAVEVLYEIGIDLSRHRSKCFDDLGDEYYDLVITLSPESQHRAVELTRTMAVDLEFWHMFDLSFVEGNRDVCLNAYRHVRDQLMERIRERFPPAPPIDI